jgi:hypothetical protein
MAAGKGRKEREYSPYVDSMTRKRKKKGCRCRRVVVVCAVSRRVFAFSSSYSTTASSSDLTAPKMVTGLKTTEGATFRVVIISARFLRSSSTWPREKKEKAKEVWYKDDADPLCSVRQRRHRKGVGSDRTDSELPQPTFELQPCCYHR